MSNISILILNNKGCTCKYKPFQFRTTYNRIFECNELFEGFIIRMKKIKEQKMTLTQNQHI